MNPKEETLCQVKLKHKFIFKCPYCCACCAQNENCLLCRDDVNNRRKPYACLKDKECNGRITNPLFVVLHPKRKY